MSDTRSYGRGARILSVGIATTGLVTFAYFSLAKHALSDAQYENITVLWAVLFLIISIIYRPVEQLLARSLSVRRAQAQDGAPAVRTALTIQAGFAAVFLAVALAARRPIQDGVLAGSAFLYWVLVVAVLAYAASYFARGWLAGNAHFGSYGGLVLLEACSRCLFALAVVVGLATGQSVVALGIAAAPLVSLIVVPLALRRRAGAVPPVATAEASAAAAGGPAEAGASAVEPSATGAKPASSDLSLREGGGFAGAVLAIMAAEQALLNAPVLIVDATATNEALAGFAFTVLLITRAPLQLFQAIQTTLLPHLSGLAATDGHESFRHALRVTLLAIAGFAGLVVIGLALIGPWAMELLFPPKDSTLGYDRFGLVLVGAGMGFHLAAGTLNQAALARGRARPAAAAWVGSGALFLVWLALSPLADPILAVEAGYCGVTALLAIALWRIEAGGRRTATGEAQPAHAVAL
ncbi:MAG: polysaccharide biosynthesis protein [uncultured Solirubrobacteraceae bacterium]|uniref:Polysaccharide biosynthesis protein n=1 Tax=uncultured Solirubrobacteraceae bacterium TaxID=1162706 RepID=A0A6J4RQ64_9ACTN|nr:MAG: polysaccharide biosynthesis protein [uncultured Solirubrobacteraceae bacterium]